MTNEELTFEVSRLAGETLALQTILFQLLFHIERKADDPIRKALDDAGNIIEHMAISAGASVSPQHLTKALQIVEQARKSIIRDKKKEP